MNIETINLILVFLQRAQLHGGEAPKFMECVTALHNAAKSIEEQEQLSGS